MSTSKPSIVLIPGLWVGPTVYDKVSEQLESRGYDTAAVALPSTGTPSPGNGDMHDDEAAIRSIVQRLVEEEEKEVVMVVHSAGGFLGCGAVKGLTAKARGAEGKEGGVKKIVCLSAGLAEEGTAHGPRPFMVFDHAAGTMTCVTPKESLFNDLPDDEAEKWLAMLKPQPATGWDATIEFAAWKEVPSVYLIGERDSVLPTQWQEMFAKLAGSRIERCDAGHCAMLSCPERVVEVIVGAAEEV